MNKTVIDIETVKDFIDKSKVILIATDTISESMIPSLVDNYITYDYTNIEVDVKSFIRDIKLSMLLKSKPSSVYLDIQYHFHYVKNSVRTISALCDDLDIKFFIFTKLYRGMTGKLHDGISYNLMGGSSSLYVSDLAINIVENKIKVIKNRHG